MELRVERALARFDFDEDRLHVARAAIRAMREPTFRMIDEGATSSDETCLYPEVVWQAMIDAASPEEK